MTVTESLRTQILSALREALEPHDDVLAFWEAGSAAMGRADHMSDLDLQVLVADGRVEDTRKVVETALLSLRPFEIAWEVPRPTFHGNWQAFYRLEGYDPLLLVDLCILEEKSPNKFLEPEMHGHPCIYFDKGGRVKPQYVPAAEMAAKIRGRLPLIEAGVELFHAFVEKELRRGRPVDALHFYLNTVVPRLVEALRTRYCPWRYNFGLRYLGHDLPADVYDQVGPLLYVASPEELLEKKLRALALLRQTLAEVKALDLEAELESRRDPVWKQ